MRFFATCSRNLADLLAHEVEALGGRELRARAAGVSFQGDLETAYRVIVYARLASRVLLELDSFDAGDPDALYEAARAFAWDEVLSTRATFAVFTNRRGETAVRDTRFAGLRLKDAIADHFTDRVGIRPDVDTERPGVAVDLLLEGSRALASVDLSGAMHVRGYRPAGAEAPLRETLAAGMLLRAGWPHRFESGHFVDPFCGSATLAIEAAMLAGEVAPGLRRGLGSPAFRGHDRSIFDRTVARAQQRAEAGRERLRARGTRFVASDADPHSVDVAHEALAHAQMSDVVELLLHDASAARAPGPTGLVATNPPWGKRLGDDESTRGLYAQLGTTLREHFRGWDAAILVGDKRLGLELGLHARKRHDFPVGNVEAQLLRVRVDEAAARAPKPDPEERERKAAEGAFANRLQKNRKRLRKWIEQEAVECYRVYDADMPEYAFAVDVYGDHAHVQEYAPPKTVDEAGARRRRGEALAAIRAVLELPRERVHLKRRQRQRGASQYQAGDEDGANFIVSEGPAKFWVNLDAYLDTGLFLDHRPMRLHFGKIAKGKRFLNLFGYTGAATVHAALGGALKTTTVDTSRTYLDWAQRNLELNEIRPAPHELVRDDVESFLAQAGRRTWDLIFLDPPTFSNSKSRDATFDVQRDHVRLIRAALEHLIPGGTLIFSTNARKFELEAAAFGDVDVQQLGAWTVPPDFSRRRPHRAWQFVSARRRSSP